MFPPLWIPLKNDYRIIFFQLIKKENLSEINTQDIRLWWIEYSKLDLLFPDINVIHKHVKRGDIVTSNPVTEKKQVIEIFVLYLHMKMSPKS